MTATGAVRKSRDFDPGTFLATIGEGRKTVAVPKKQTIFSQGDVADAVFYIQEGKVRLTVVSKTGKEGVPETVVPKISQETLAEMVGTTRSRVSFFMNRFRKLGFIHYSGGEEGGLQVHSSLLSVVLHD